MYQLNFFYTPPPRKNKIESRSPKMSPAMKITITENSVTVTLGRVSLKISHAGNITTVEVIGREITVHSEDSDDPTTYTFPEGDCEPVVKIKRFIDKSTHYKIKTSETYEVSTIKPRHAPIIMIGPGRLTAIADGIVINFVNGAEKTRELPKGTRPVDFYEHYFIYIIDYTLTIGAFLPSPTAIHVEHGATSYRRDGSFITMFVNGNEVSTFDLERPK